MIKLNLKNFVLVALAILSNCYFAKGQISCHMPPITNTPAQQFSTGNASICSNYENYVPSEDLVNHTPTKIVKLNFHYFITDDPNNPRNLTETTGFSNTDTWNTGIQFAKDIIIKLNQKASQNSPMTVPLEILFQI
jgi:hypothetical protein